MNIPELLAPAGSPSCAVAAIQNGADALYLGLKQGSARAGADNFTWNELEETLEYAHTRHCRVYLALNTLFNHEELKQAVADAHKAASLGVDALIIQDIGLAATLLAQRASGQFPATTQIHASTQMSVATPAGARFLKEQGFDRLITARELSIEELQALCQAGLPVECFVHGALCMSYSGQCLLSSFIGGRSGNRGACAQPCRMAYTLNTGKSGHLLSPKDFCALPLLDRLVQAGVTSLKIEGRLKAPTYAALTTAIYRKALDQIQQGTFDAYKASGELHADMERLELLFSRGHFTTGYLTGKIPTQDITDKNPGRKGLPIGAMTATHKLLPRPGQLPAVLQLYTIQAKLTKTVMPGDGITVLTQGEQPYCGGTVNKISGETLTIVGTPPATNSQDQLPCTVYLTHSVAEQTAIERTFAPGAERPRVGLTMTLTAKVGQPASLTVVNPQGNTVTVHSVQPVTRANNAPTDQDRMKAQLTKLGGTPYFAADVRIEADPLVFMPVSVLNQLRRDALASLPPCQQIPVPIHPHPVKCPRPMPILSNKSITLYFYQAEDFLEMAAEALAAYQPYLIYVPYTLWQEQHAVTEATAKAHRAGAKCIAAFPFLALGKSQQELEVLLPDILRTADGVQITNLGDLSLLPRELPEDFLVCADASLNIANQAAAQFLIDQGVQILTLSPEAFADGDPDGCTEVITKGPIPLMRTRHCMIRAGKPHCGRCQNGKKMYTLTDSHGADYPVLPLPQDCQNVILSSGDWAKQPGVHCGSLQRINIIKERPL